MSKKSEVSPYLFEVHMPAGMSAESNYHQTPHAVFFFFAGHYDMFTVCQNSDATAVQF